MVLIIFLFELIFIYRHYLSTKLQGSEGNHVTQKQGGDIMMPKALWMLLLVATTTSTAFAEKDILIKLKPGAASQMAVLEAISQNGRVENLDGDWIHLMSTQDIDLKSFKNKLQNNAWVEYAQPNYKINLMEDYQATSAQLRAAAVKILEDSNANPPIKDNPEIPNSPASATGLDPLISKQWGMNDIGGVDTWKSFRGNSDMIVAVIDTGVDYTHEDLLPNMWRNPGEEGLDANGKNKATNGLDDDQNGYADDIVGWDFVSNDNKPYDLAVDPMQLLAGGGNPGHGTHCAGNVGARGGNNIGISGVAPGIKMMALRFISEKGAGTTAEAIKSIRYAVDNGARVLSNSWGSEGEDPNDGAENKALRDAIQYCQDKGALFVAAAGNGHKGVGYNNDSDSKPAYPASYDHDAIVSVAALDSTDKLGTFSNWGYRTVDIGAPGVKVFSTTVGGNYSDTVLDMFGYTVYWDGTSMATPHVAGAAALYWSAHPNQTWQDVKAALLSTAKPIPVLNGKVSSNGKLNLKSLMAR
jgi:subtilisin family serine protease